MINVELFESQEKIYGVDCFNGQTEVKVLDVNKSLNITPASGCDMVAGGHSISISRNGFIIEGSNAISNARPRELLGDIRMFCYCLEKDIAEAKDFVYNACRNEAARKVEELKLMIESITESYNL